MFDFTGTKVLVTGAGSADGIGFAAAKAFAGAGASVVVSSMGERCHERAAELRALGAKAWGVHSDLSEPENAEQLLGDALGMLGGLDVLVNNAGMTSQVQAASDTGEAAAAANLSPAGWRTAISRNLDSAFFVTRAALPALRRSGRGRIVMVSSVTGPVMAMRNDAGYAAAKAGMVGLTRSIALDEAIHGVTCNAVAPGWIATASLSAAEAAEGIAAPVGRSGTPLEVASAIFWLASREAAYVTGQVLVVDGGNSIREERA